MVCYSVFPTYILKYRWISKTEDRRKMQRKFFILHLMMDDTVYTNKLLDLLDEQKVPATFFMVAESAKQHPGIVERMKKNGYSIGIHSQKHESAMLQLIGKTGRDLKKSVEIMEKLGVDIKGYRPPWGHLNLASLYWIKKLHLNLVFWDVMAQDWSADETPDSICNKILRRVFPELL
ncbi:MAG: polysaccharide deacetylase family protein [Dorea sp.]